MVSTAYIAGFFDGEGCVGIYKNGRQSYHLRTQLRQNKSGKVSEVFILLLSHFGGNLGEQTSLSGKPTYNWQLNGDKAVAFLEAILPHLRLKKTQAEFAIAWHKSRPPVVKDARGRNQSHPPAQQAADEVAANHLKAMKGTKP